jgi:hypothetical protein
MPMCLTANSTLECVASTVHVPVGTRLVVRVATASSWLDGRSGQSTPLHARAAGSDRQLLEPAVDERDCHRALTDRAGDPLRRAAQPYAPRSL